MLPDSTGTHSSHSQRELSQGTKQSSCLNLKITQPLGLGRRRRRAEHPACPAPAPAVSNCLRTGSVPNPPPRRNPPPCHPHSWKKTGKSRRRDQSLPQPHPAPLLCCQMQSPRALSQDPASSSIPSSSSHPTQCVPPRREPQRADATNPSGVYPKVGVCLSC